jgi:hypothetical protein
MSIEPHPVAGADEAGYGTIAEKDGPSAKKFCRVAGRLRERAPGS